jgi:hypothetical protein
MEEDEWPADVDEWSQLVVEEDLLEACRENRDLMPLADIQLSEGDEDDCDSECTFDSHENPFANLLDWPVSFLSELPQETGGGRSDP